MSTAAPLQSTAAKSPLVSQVVSRGIAVAAQMCLRRIGVIVINW